MVGKPFKPGERPIGRAKGTPNKNTTALKEMILQALDRAGGPDYLLRQSKENPGPFLTLIGKVLPMTVVGDPDAPIKHKVTIEFL